ncbi:conserved hypothetical protein [Desulfamplus magnetovallimortis]|uniref:Dinitrogenase iron-molybdenum cofactor biosynthesis domain-containing protein n=1 Tax=Desulfamplus magnetovallimortis TaxID=1246637 RepID=A0A1W1HJF6_9BACT|nr:hypothetical protein [Desulfamplus magnetovallimortis]SLM32594.1 conserved hypothetical protein [Desulfamplus magnetovallimortis]
MNIAFTAWDKRISPVFDASRNLFVVKVSDGKVLQSFYEPFNPEIMFSFKEKLKMLEIDVLVCGAISQICSSIIESTGVMLIPFIGGRIDDILDGYLRDNSINHGFIMPGCGRRYRRKSDIDAFGYQGKEVRIMPKGNNRGQQGQGRGQGQGQGQGRGQGQGKGQGQGRGQSQGRCQGQGNNRGGNGCGGSCTTQGSGKGNGQGKF